MKLRLYNTLTSRKEEFTALNPPQVKIYSCGPTVYSHTHLGHMRTYTNTDILLKTLRYFDFVPFQAMNITDVGHLTDDGDQGEDKMEKAARQEKLDAWQVAEKYTKEFFSVLDQLNITRADVVGKATDNITEMIALVKCLEKKGYTYSTSDGIYFDTAKLSDYAKLANVSLEDLQEGARVEKNPEKKNPTDFALWKLSPPDSRRQMEWASPWGEKSFPGWHIECSTMAMKYLTNCFIAGKFYPDKFETIDIHTGGIEHINVHHTNEIAQAEAATGKKFVRFWLHNNWLQVAGAKMSKSKGNFYTQKDLSKRGYENLMPLRYLFLNTHYRKKMNFTWSALAGAKNSWQRLVQLVYSWPKDEGGGEGKEKWQRAFKAALADDLNVTEALAVVWQMAKSSLKEGQKRQLMAEFDQVLGLQLIAAADHIEVPPGIEKLANQREELRQQGQWDQADKLRQEIASQGYQIEDTPQGPRVKKKL